MLLLRYIYAVPSFFEILKKKKATNNKYYVVKYIY